METLRYVVLVNGLLAVVSIAFYVLLRRETFFGANRLALWLGLTASFVLPLLELPDWRPQPVKAVMHRTAQVIVPKVLPSPSTPQPDVTIRFPNGRTYPAFPKQMIRSGWSWQQGVLGLYVAVLLFLLIRFGLRLRSLMRLIRQSAQEPYEGFTLVTNASNTSPFSFFGWVVLNPDHHAPDELDQILRHERVHVRERHSLDMIAAELVSIVFWFNPAAYLFRQLVHQTLEFSADRAVLAEGIDPTSYQYHLVKVSLSAGQSAITNHFSKSELKSRIVMLNKPNSAPSAWLKYPVLCIAALTVVSTFARPQMKKLAKYVPAPVAETMSVVAQAIQTPTGVRPPAEQPPAPIIADVVIKPVAAAELDTISLTRVAADVADSVKTGSVLTSPNRYMAYEGDYLYWVVTPKTTLDDFTVMKQVSAQYGRKMQLKEIKYDPLYAYIEHIVFSSGAMSWNQTDTDDKPISYFTGYMKVDSASHPNAIRNSSYVSWDKLPQILKKVVTDDEAATAQFIKEHRMEYLVLAGNQTFPQKNGFTATYPKELVVLRSSKLRTGLTVLPDKSLSVADWPEDAPVFINNKPATRDAVRRLTVDKLYSVVRKEGTDPTKKKSDQSALLIYINEDN